ncbi:MAG: hypothetical protein HUJ25_01235 [Crocinitomicaceae bacterium]|nr:hypothetical protein [Crocinitomicaceae bacterium]
MKELSLVIVCLTLLFGSCKKEKTTWGTDWSAPIVHGQLTINDLIPSDYTTTNGDNYLSIVYNEKAFGISLDSIVDFPDTSIVEKTALGFGLDINPGFIWVKSADQVLDIPEIELKEILAKQGTITFICRSEWGGKTIMTLDFPKVILQGVPFNKSYYLEAGSVTNPTVEVDAVNMAGYWIDLKGLDGNQVNTLSGNFIVESDEPVNSYFVSIYDSLEYEINFSDVVLDYARGYFGKHELADTTAVSLPFMDAVLAGTIDIDSIDMTINIRNGFNIISQAKITLLRGINSKTGTEVDLNFPLLGASLNINPATGGLYDWDYSNYPITINNTNSNINQFIENLSDSILIGYEILLNPDGNVTAGTDEIFPGSTIDLMVNGEFPVDIGANNLTLTDTFNFSYNGNELYTGKNAQITLSYENGFPMGAEATLYMLDENDILIDDLQGNTGIQSGTYNPGSYLTTPFIGSVVFNLSDQDILNLQSTQRMALIVSFTTDSGQKVKIDASAAFDFAVRSNLQIDLHL